MRAFVWLAVLILLLLAGLGSVLALEVGRRRATGLVDLHRRGYLRAIGMAAGLAAGAALGLGLGAALGNLVLWLVLGPAIGTLLGATAGSALERRDEEAPRPLTDEETGISRVVIALGVVLLAVAIVVVALRVLVR